MNSVSIPSYSRRREWSRRLRIILLAILLRGILITLFLRGLDLIFIIRERDTNLVAQFVANQMPAHVHYLDWNGRKIRYVVAGSDTLPTLFYVHGAPSSIFVGLPYLTHPDWKEKFRFVSMDRPGYGYSGLGHPVTDIAEQGRMGNAILGEIENGKPVVVVGVSYGGPVVCEMAKQDNRMDAGVLISASVKSGAEYTFPISGFLQYPPVSWMLTRFLYASNVEKLSHARELENINRNWNRIQVPFLILHGEKDELVYPENADFSHTRIPGSTLIWAPGKGHYLSFSDREWIIRQILTFSPVAGFLKNS